MAIYAHLTGRLGRDAEVRSTPNGKSVTGFAIGTDHGYGDRKKTIWVDCALWGERGEKLAQYLTKGKLVSVHGDLDVDEYQKKDGTAGHKLKLDVRGLELCGGGEGRQEPQHQPQPAYAPSGGGMNDDIPF
jgi:single-strand DNA-binding protein